MHDDERTPQRVIIDQRFPNAWPSTGCPTDGFVRACLAAIGIETRGREMKRVDLLRLCRENGLPFADKAAKDDANTTSR